MRLAMGSRQWAMGGGVVAGDRISSYRDLAAWQRAFELGRLVYEVTADFPASERFGLTSQMRRGGVSIASNIAEGYGRGRPGDYLKFLRISRGALFELETQVLFAKDLGYLLEADQEALQQAIDATAKPLSGLIRSLEDREERGTSRPF